MPPKYEILDKVGEGGAGAVFRARAPGGTLVAVKLLKSLKSPDALARFEREQRLLRELGELEGFVPLLDAGVGPQGPWLVMPFLAGGTLRDRISRRPRLTIAEAVAVTGRIAVAMGRAHARGLVHRDLKPENVLFAANGRPLVADLGLAKHWRRDLPGGEKSIALSRAGEFAGTAGYTAPEQMLSSRDALPSADVFSLGAILYECLSGKYAFTGETFVEVVTNVQARVLRPIVELLPACPDELAAIVDRALALDPTQRPADGNALARELSACPLVRPPARPPILVDSNATDTTATDSTDTRVADSTVADSRPTGASVFEWVEPRKTPRRAWLPLVAGAAGLAAIVVLVGVSLARSQQAARERDRVEANVREIHRLVQLARERAETPGPQSAAAADEALGLLAALPPERRERALEAETREAVAWGDFARGFDASTVAAAGSALALVAPDSPVAGSLQLLCARAHLRAGQPADALADLAHATSLEAKRLRAQTLLALRRWSELGELAPGTDDFLRMARAWARFRLSGDPAPAHEALKALGPGGRESFASALRLAEARAKLLALAVPGDVSEVASRPARPFEALESFVNLLLAAWRSPRKALLDGAEDSAALEHALRMAVCFTRVFVLHAAGRTLVCADRLEEAVGLVDVEGTPERARDGIWLAQLFESIFFQNVLTEHDVEPRRATQAERLARARAFPGPFPPEVEHARRRARVLELMRLERRRQTTPLALIEALEQALAAPPGEGTLFIDYPLVEGLFRWNHVDQLARLASTLEPGPERERRLAAADADLVLLQKVGTATGTMREMNLLEFLVAFVRGDDARAETLLVGFDLAPREDATPLSLGLSSSELLLAGELRRRQGRIAEAEAWLELSSKLRSVPANSESTHYGSDPAYAFALVLLRDPARRSEGLARLERIVAREADYPPPLPWLEAETHAAVGK